MKTIKFNELSNELLHQMETGAFLTVKDKNNEINTMTIAWGTIGYMWFKPVFMVMVRNIRHTFKLIENSDEFTVSVPLKGQLNTELTFCGTKSGRDHDKIKECNLNLTYFENFNTPIIDQCNLHYLCKIIYKVPLDPKIMNEEILSVYTEEDYHTLYHGEIIHTLFK